MDSKDLPRVRSITPRRVTEGEGATALRLLGDGLHHDPFVLFDEYTVPEDAFFPLHPHSGFEGFQFLLEGSTRYEDNLGNVGIIGPQGARRFLCTDGFKHSERPVGGEMVRGFLVWVRLPKDQGQLRPLYRQVGPDEIPARSVGDIKALRVVGPGSPLGSTAPFIFDVLEGGGPIDLRLQEGESGLIHVVKGEASLEGRAAGGGEGMLLTGPLEASTVLADGSLAAYVQGRALGGRFEQVGPNVM